MTRQRGIAAVEFAMVLPVLLMFFFLIVDFGRAILVRQVLINVSREAANLAARGTSLEDAIAAVQTSAAPLDLGAHGFVILTEVLRDSNGNLVVRRQASSGGAPGGSRVGTGLGNAAVLPLTSTLIPPIGQVLLVAEVYYRSAPLTPLGPFLNVAIGEQFYDVAFF